MRLSFRKTTAAWCLGVFACASGAADDQANGTGAATGTPGSGGTVSMTTQVITTVINGTTTTITTVVPITGGTTSTGSTSSGSTTAATGGTVTTACEAATPDASWKSFAACGVTTAVLDAAYATWRSSYFVDCGTGEAYINKGDGTTVSEGIGYGMLLAANFGKSDDFIKLAAFYNTRMSKNNGLMPWKYPVGCNTSASDPNAAADGDIDAALALIVATKKGIGSYSSQATTVISAIKSTLMTTCGSQSYVLPGNGGWASCNLLNPSYFSPGHFRVFASFTGDSSWNTYADNVYVLLTAAQNGFNGLVSDWTNSSGSAVADPNATRPQPCYGYEACRVPWRIVLDYGWWLNASAKTFLSNIKTKRIDPVSLPTAVTTGVTGDDWTSSYENNSCHKGGFALVGTAFDQTTVDSYIGAWRNRFLAGDTGDYYMQTLKLLFLVTAGGKFASGL